jgi:hypothetical protein
MADQRQPANRVPIKLAQSRIPKITITEAEIMVLPENMERNSDSERRMQQTWKHIAESSEYDV